MPDTVSFVGAKDRLPLLAEKYPLDFEHAICVIMPCCGFSFDYGHEDMVPGESSQVFDPPRWTCPNCNVTYTIGQNGLTDEF